MDSCGLFCFDSQFMPVFFALRLLTSPVFCSTVKEHSSAGPLMDTGCPGTQPPPTSPLNCLQVTNTHMLVRVHGQCT